MIVRSAMNDGWSVTALAASIASCSACDVLVVAAGLRPVDGLDVPAVGLVAGARRPRLKAMLVSSSIEIWLSS